MWSAIIILIIVFIYGYQLEKRIRSIEETRGPSYSQRFWIDPSEAILKYDKLGDVLGIKSIKEGKSYDKWTKEDKDKWNKNYSKDFFNDISLHITYLQSENAYFVKAGSNSPYFSYRDSTNNYVYSKIIAGDKDGFKNNIEFVVYDRLMKDKEGKYHWVITPCIKFSDGAFKGKSDFINLCDFPIFSADRSDEFVRKFGFEVKRSGGDDFYEDDFGEHHSILTEVEYKKNGVIFRYFY